MSGESPEELAELYWNMQRGRLSLDEWVLDRYENCVRLAQAKRGKDRNGWLEDAAYFREILKVLQLAAERQAKGEQR